MGIIRYSTCHNQLHLNDCEFVLKMIVTWCTCHHIRDCCYIQEWIVENITTERHEKVYACCVETYPDVTFTIHLRRGSLFYVVNLIAPCFLIFIISFLGFFLPVESGDKVNLETTILLALVVFLLMVSETMPPIPDVIPVLGLYAMTSSIFDETSSINTLTPPVSIWVQL